VAGGSCGVICGANQALALEGLRETIKPTVVIVMAGVLAKILIRHPPNTNQKCHRPSQLVRYEYS
jgi:hypothetical protein